MAEILTSKSGCRPHSKYPVLHLGAFGDMGFLFMGPLGSQASTGISFNYEL